MAGNKTMYRAEASLLGLPNLSGEETHALVH
jgi:hypothetical protein